MSGRCGHAATIDQMDGMESRCPIIGSPPPSRKASPADNILAEIRPARGPPWRGGFLPVNCRPGGDC